MNTEIKLKNGDIVERFNMLNQTLNLKGLKLLYARDRNLSKLSALAHPGNVAEGKKSGDLSFEKRFPKSQAYKEYEKKLAEQSKAVYEEFSKDKDGNAKTKFITHPMTGQETEVFDVDMNDPKFKAALSKVTNKLEKEYADAIKEMADNREKYIDFLNLDFEFPEELKLHTISLEDVNPDISEMSFTAIAWMIKDE